jgi:hypothetical protein
MSGIKDRLDELMGNIEERNPNASWGNLLTGIGILVLIAVASVWYFGQSPNSNNIIEDLAGSIGITEPSEEEGETPGTTAEIPEGMVEVQVGEGLWQIAERVCGDPERYNYLADANGLNIWSGIIEGQMLVIDCGPSK